jgi:hypothetical protein
MQLNLDALYEAAMKLPDNERLDLAARLLDTMPPGIMSEDDPGFIEELERRFNDASPTVPWSEIRDRH